MIPYSPVCYTIGVMCIQVRGKDQYDQPLTAEKAAELSAYAMNNARLKVHADVSPTSTSFELQMAFKDQFVSEVSKLTGGKATSSVSYGSCSGSIPSHQYDISPFGVFSCQHIE